MANTLQLIVGLGNPGTQYQRTRHNAGAWYVEQLAQRHAISLKEERKFNALIGRGHISGHDIRLVIPTTFMNNSGTAIAAVAHFYKVAAVDMLVAHDELDLQPGIARFKSSGGHGGHNGLRDIISSLGDQKDFHRLRIGIGHPGNSRQVSDFVLSVPPSAECNFIAQAIDEASKHSPLAIEQNWSKAMNQLHSFNAQDI